MENSKEQKIIEFHHFIDFIVWKIKYLPFLYYRQATVNFHCFQLLFIFFFFFFGKTRLMKGFWEEAKETVPMFRRNELVR